MNQKNLTPSFFTPQDWYQKTSIRNTPRRILAEIHPEQKFFPIARQPLAIHPLITNRGDQYIDYILIQTAYRYMYEIAVLEIENVNTAALKIVTNKHSFKFSDEYCQQALSIIIDEAYHAYVALDFIQQTKEKTGIEPICLPKSSPLQKILDNLKIDPFEKYYDLLELVTICLSEHVLTKDLVYMSHEEKTCEFFNHIMQDHLLDETRHAGYFSKVLKYIWKNINEDEKEIISLYLPTLVESYIDTSFQKEDEKTILRHMGLQEHDIETILYDTYFETDKNLNRNVIIFLSALRKNSILDHPQVKQTFRSHGFKV